ncbi:MAG: YicC/YloC family endoribonuclease [Pseudomonadota bacterium]
MSLSSMTGFARCEGDADGTHWVWEIRSVNGKGLDIRLRLPSGFDRLDMPSRKVCNAVLNRGNLQLNLTLTGSAETAALQVNEGALQMVLSRIADLNKSNNFKKSTAAEILAVRGVLEPSANEQSPDARDSLDKALIAGLEETVQSLENHRKSEGAALADMLLGHISTIETLVGRAKADPATHIDAIRERFEKQLDQLIERNGKLDNDRLEQEIAILATKADIREEIDRLEAHIAAARDLIAKGSPVGRKLEFLAQEFNRECNTLCSKSNAISITQTGLDMKVVIDQFREQVLNVE